MLAWSNGMTGCLVPLKDIVISRDYLFENTILRHDKDSKFVSEYQARVYDNDINGDGLLDYSTSPSVFNVLTLVEYFAEGYNYCIVDPKELMRKDKRLFYFIENIETGGD